VSFVKENRCANGTSCVVGGGGVGGFRDDGPALAAGCGRGAVFARLACSFSCCLLNCASFCASAIATKSLTPKTKQKNSQHPNSPSSSQSFLPLVDIITPSYPMPFSDNREKMGYDGV
jgi:hypothetical protein